MIVLKPAKSYQLIEECLERYNDGKPLKDRIRKQHYEAMQALVRILQLEVGNYQRTGLKGATRRCIRQLHTNRKQLAKWLKVCEKSVYNHLKRLEVAGWIKRIWHGSNASFGVEINTDLLWLQETTAPDAGNVAGKFENPLPPLLQSLPHTLSPSVTRPVTNEYNELSGLPSGDAPAATPAATPTDAPTAVNQQQRVTETDYHPDSNATAPQQPAPAAPTKKVPQKKAPPPEVPATVAQVCVGLTPSQTRDLTILLDSVWNYAMERLDGYLPPYLIPSEEAKGRAALAEFFVYSNPAAWKAAAAQFVKRIDLVRGWLDRRADVGKKAFVPIPSVYFDHRNPRGFRTTKAWYKTYSHQLKVAKEESIISRALKAHWKAVQSGVPAELEEATRVIRQRLGKLGLYDRFTAKIFTHGTVNLASQS